MYNPNLSEIVVGKVQRGRGITYYTKTQTTKVIPIYFLFSYIVDDTKMYFSHSFCLRIHCVLQGFSRGGGWRRIQGTVAENFFNLSTSPPYLACNTGPHFLARACSSPINIFPHFFFIQYISFSLWLHVIFCIDSGYL